MDPYLLTSAIYKRIMGKREDEPRCEVCGRFISELIGQMISRNVSRGLIRYYCKEHDPERRRIG